MSDSYKKIRKEPLYIPDPPRGWDISLWNKVLKVANKMSRQELIIAWLDSLVGKVSDNSFNKELVNLGAFSRQELIDLIHEIGQDGGEKLLIRYGHYLSSESNQRNFNPHRFVV